MPDPIFAAEMAALEAERRTKEKGRVGDGMAAGPVNGEPAGWMEFSGERVPVPPSREPAFTGWNSMRHSHSGASECLETVVGGMRLVPRGDVEVAEPGWLKCQHNGVRYHLHGERLIAHFSGDRRACPNGVPALPLTAAKGWQESELREAWGR